MITLGIPGAIRYYQAGPVAAATGTRPVASLDRSVFFLPSFYFLLSFASSFFTVAESQPPVA
jgi:hypothetical protein